MTTLRWTVEALATAAVILPMRTAGDCESSRTPWRALLAPDAEQVCVQTPYMEQSVIEAAAGAPVTDYQVEHNAYVMWIFSKGAGPRQVPVSNVLLGLPIDPPSKTCYPVDDAHWVYRCTPDDERYAFD